MRSRYLSGKIPDLWLLLCLILLLVGTTAASSPPPAPPPTPTPPPGFEVLDQAPGVQLYRNTNNSSNRDYVQMIDLSQGASIVAMHGEITSQGSGRGIYGGPDPTLLRQPLGRFWQQLSSAYPNAFCVATGQFFLPVTETTARLPFPLKVDGDVLSEGSDTKNYPDQQLVLEIWDDRADIIPLSEQALYGSTAPNIVTGLKEDARKGLKVAVPRTFAGVDDRDGDGKYETVLIYSTRTAYQWDAAGILREFGADKVLMFDGGGSTQLTCQGTPLIPSERAIPQVLGVVAGEAVPPTATVDPQLSATSSAEATTTGEIAYPAAGSVGSGTESHPSDVFFVIVLILPIAAILGIIVIRLQD